ncbi:META domain-containing protein [Niabella insulamsoli]|uniref:META domain-containing protein n=1 Tax=Niabella insulamsoli TaxID=3144874 RepID=UPI0031FD3928
MKNKKLEYSILGLAIIAILNSCSKEDRYVLNGGDIVGEWIVKSKASNIRDGYLRFLENDSVYLMSGCDNFSGTYQINENTIIFSTEEGLTTLPACYGIAYDARKLQDLTVNYGVSGNTLFIKSRDEHLLIKAEKK